MAAYNEQSPEEYIDNLQATVLGLVVAMNDAAEGRPVSNQPQLIADAKELLAGTRHELVVYW